MTITEHIMQIMQLALLIDPPEVEDVGCTRPAVFVEWSPHCNSFAVRVFRDGWNYDAETTTEYRLSTDRENAAIKLAEIEIYLEILAREVGVL